jgi:hypothetical protein
MVDIFNDSSVDVENSVQSPDVEYLKPKIDVFVQPVQGLTGPTGGEVYHHIQSTPAASWFIPHGLGTQPEVLLFTDSDGDQPVQTDIHYNDNMMDLIVVWSSPETGEAFLK